MIKSRFKFSLKIAAIHLLASIIVALLAAALVWFGWYPWPYNQILKISGLYQLIIIVDVICGPLLTFILGNPKKSAKETTIDISFVALIQVAALIYGLYALYIVRPVAVVFEVDRFVVLSANEINDQRKFPLLGINEYAQRDPKDVDEKLAMLDFALQGMPTASNPEWWVEFSDEIREKAVNKTKTLEQLQDARPQKSKAIEALSEKHNLPIDQLLYIPFVSTSNFAWISILNSEGHIIDYAEINGFI